MPIRVAKIQNTKQKIPMEYVENQEVLLITNWNSNDKVFFKKCLAISYKARYLPLNLAIVLLDIYPSQLKILNMFHKVICGSLIHNCQKLAATKIPLNI